MKTLPGNNAGPQWNSTLLNDLAFIKKHLRYKLSKRTLPSTVLTFAFLLLIFRMLWVALLLSKKVDTLTFCFIIAMMLIIFATGIWSYWNRLRFKVIPTPFFAVENTKLVDEFLRSQQLNVYRHPQAPEVLQILSRPLGNTDQREVMIFIADDKRILVNSHFINQKWTITPQSRNARNMANRLREWLSIHYPNTNTSIITR